MQDSRGQGRCTVRSQGLHASAARGYDSFHVLVGLWSGTTPGNVGIRKAQRRIHEDEAPMSAAQAGGRNKGFPRSLLQCRQGRIRGWGLRCCKFFLVAMTAWRPEPTLNSLALLRLVCSKNDFPVRISQTQLGFLRDVFVQVYS